MNTDPNKVNRLYLYLIIFALIVGMAGLFHYYSNKDLRLQIEARNIENKDLKEDIKRLDESLTLLKEEKEGLIEEADSLEAKETYYKNKYYIVNEKLRKVLADYNSATPDGKWELFTDSINEEW